MPTSSDKTAVHTDLFRHCLQRIVASSSFYSSSEVFQLLLLNMQTKLIGLGIRGETVLAIQLLCKVNIFLPQANICALLSDSSVSVSLY